MRKFEDALYISSKGYAAVLRMTSFSRDSQESESLRGSESFTVQRSISTVLLTTTWSLGKLRSVQKFDQ